MRRTLLKLGDVCEYNLLLLAVQNTVVVTWKQIAIFKWFVISRVNTRQVNSHGRLIESKTRVRSWLTTDRLHRQSPSTHQRGSGLQPGMDKDANIMSSTIPKRRKATCRQCSGCSAKNCRTGEPNASTDDTSSREPDSSDAGASSRSPHALPPTLTETINVLDHTIAGEEDVVDLTCEGTELAAVVDLTNNDSIVVVDEGPEGRQATRESYVVSSDEEEEDVRTLLNAALLTSLQASSQARATPGTISCPVCMESYAEIVDAGRLVVSTKCGHVFCSQCIRDSLAHSHTCPACRKKLTPRQYHPIYI